MKTSCRILIPMLLASTTIAAGQAGPARGAEARARLAERLNRFADQVGEATTGVLAVSVAGHPVVIRGIGRPDDGVRLDERTVFDVGSITKQFTAAAILALEAEGKLKVTDPVRAHLPAAPPAWRSMTVHHLLTHTSGLPPQIGDDYEPLDRAAFLARAFAAPLGAAPGARYVYSNVGYAVLAAIIELRAGVGYEAYLQTLFARAGMRETGYRIPGFAPERTAIGYRSGRPWGRPNEQPWAADGPYWNLRGNGGMLSTAADMLRWHEALLGSAVLGPEARTRMYTRHVEEGEGAGTWYGYGWALFPTPRGTTLVTHNGGNGAFFADFLRYLDEGVVIFFATNRAAPRFRGVAQQVARMIFDTTYAGQLPPEVVTTNALPATAAGRLAGAVIAALTAGGVPDLERLVAEWFAPDFRSMVPLDRHLAVLGRMQSELRGYRLTGYAAESAESVRLTLSNAGAAKVLRVMVSDGPVPRVAGLGLDER